MLFRDGSDDADLRASDLTQSSQFSRSTCSQFEHEAFHITVRPQQCQWRTDVIVQIPLGCKCFLLWSADLSEQLFGRSFPVTTGDANHRSVELIAIPSRQGL